MDNEETLLKAKREKFCVAFTEIGSESFGNGTKAAIEAGYSEASARTQAWRLLKSVDVRRRILELYNEKLRNNGVTPNSVLSNLMHDRLLARQAGQFSVAVHCTELEGKYLAMFTDRMALQTPEKAQQLDKRAKDELQALTVLRTRELGRADADAESDSNAEPDLSNAAKLAENPDLSDAENAANSQVSPSGITDVERGAA